MDLHWLSVIHKSGFSNIQSIYSMLLKFISEKLLLLGSSIICLDILRFTCVYFLIHDSQAVGSFF